jgi:uncharacterized damage-inducible protein DinB
MVKQSMIEQLKTQQSFLMNTISCFSEDDSSFKPKDELFTVAQHLGHTAETITWFFEGAFGKGFDMNFENYEEKMKKYTSFNECVELYNKNTNDAIAKIESLSEEELYAPIEGEIMKGAPKLAIIYGLGDHTAHHRGALSVYARLLDKTPKMPYSDM